MTPTNTTVASFARPLRDLRLLSARLVWWIPVVLGTVYVVILVVHIGPVLGAIYSNGDAAAAPNLGELYPHAPPGATLVLGQYPWYSTLWFELATRHVPFHRVVWEIGPWIFSLLGVAL